MVSCVLNYAYDAAHRMVGLSDGSSVANGQLANLVANGGNKITYTLDNMGNRTGESKFDPSGVLQKTKTRVIDSLNRLQQDIGGTTYTAAPTSAITQYGYDNNGNLTSSTDPLNRVTTNGPSSAPMATGAGAITTARRSLTSTCPSL